MTGTFQEEMRLAIETLRVRIMEAVHGEVSARLQEALHRIARDAGLGLEVRTTALELGRVPRASPRVRAAATRARIVQCVSEAPGISVEGLARALELRRDTLRRHLAALARSGGVRVDGGETGTSEGQWRVYGIQDPDASGSNGIAAVVAAETAA